MLLRQCDVHNVALATNRATAGCWCAPRIWTAHECVGRRGTGPWPSSNTDAVVTAWLMSRLSDVEGEERRGMARWLLEHVSGQGKGERMVADMRWHESQLDRLAVMADRLNEGQPIQHVLGESWFDGLRLEVSPSVLIPRPETEELVAAMADKVAGFEGPVRVADWCTGSGCMALAMKRRHPCRVVGYEWSMNALEWPGPMPDPQAWMCIGFTQRLACGTA